MTTRKKNIEELAIDAAKGDPKAKYLMALALERGFGVAKDMGKAREYLQMLSDQTAVWANGLIGSDAKALFSQMFEMKKPVVLLLEDAPATRTKIRMILERNVGCLVVEFSDGRSGQSYLEMEDLPDLIITDIHMPHIDGFKFSQFIAGNPRLKEIPLIVISADDDKESILRGKQLGIKHWLLKSSPTSQVVLMASTLLNMSR